MPRVVVVRVVVVVVVVLVAVGVLLPRGAQPHARCGGGSAAGRIPAASVVPRLLVVCEGHVVEEDGLPRRGGVLVRAGLALFDGVHHRAGHDSFPVPRHQSRLHRRRSIGDHLHGDTKVTLEDRLGHRREPSVQYVHHPAQLRRLASPLVRAARRRAVHELLSRGQQRGLHAPCHLRQQRHRLLRGGVPAGGEVAGVGAAENGAAEAAHRGRGHPGVRELRVPVHPAGPRGGHPDPDRLETKGVGSAILGDGEGLEDLHEVVADTVRGGQTPLEVHTRTPRVVVVQQRLARGRTVRVVLAEVLGKVGAVAAVEESVVAPKLVPPRHPRAGPPRGGVHQHRPLAPTPPAHLACPRRLPRELPTVLLLLLLGRHALRLEVPPHSITLRPQGLEGGDGAPTGHHVDRLELRRHRQGGGGGEPLAERRGRRRPAATVRRPRGAARGPHTRTRTRPGKAVVVEKGGDCECNPFSPDPLFVPDLQEA
eukprot:Hpha_TRINITY_DN15165_c3_g4::TRINITY_DN15165_c3_g4_i5::g.126604::m.126604